MDCRRTQISLQLTIVTIKLSAKIFNLSQFKALKIKGYTENKALKSLVTIIKSYWCLAPPLIHLKNSQSHLNPITGINVGPTKKGSFSVEFPSPAKIWTVKQQTRQSIPRNPQIPQLNLGGFVGSRFRRRNLPNWGFQWNSLIRVRVSETWEKKLTFRGWERERSEEGRRRLKAKKKKSLEESRFQNRRKVSTFNSWGGEGKLGNQFTWESLPLPWKAGNEIPRHGRDSTYGWSISLPITYLRDQWNSRVLLVLVTSWHGHRIASYLNWGFSYVENKAFFW